MSSIADYNVPSYREYTAEEIRNHYVAALGKLFEIRGGSDQELYQAATLKWENENGGVFYWTDPVRLYPSFIQKFGVPDVVWALPHVTLHQGNLAIDITLVDSYTGEDLGIQPGNYEVTVLDTERVNTCLNEIDFFPRAYIERRLALVKMYGTIAGPTWIADLFEAFDDETCRAVLVRAALDDAFRAAIDAAHHVKDGFALFVEQQQ